MNLDKSILHQQYERDEREPEPIEWVYMVVLNNPFDEELYDATSDINDSIKIFNRAIQYSSTETNDTVELCKVNRELFSHKDWQTAYKQSEIIETKTL